MTKASLYTLLMNAFLTAATRGFATHLLSTSLLSAKAIGGGFCVLFLLALCFLCVHILKCAKVGWRHRNPKPSDPEPKPEAKEKAPAPPQEPIYYIVERKRTRAKPKYGEPKEIHFK